ncbi:MAG: hemolysin family protein [Acidimicrobiia bacterium]|nr:hemolysin family protein [Acidimicrobiia bacterium]
MSGGDTWIVVLIGVLFVFSMFLAAAETGFTRMSRIRALTMAEEGRKGAARLASMLEQPEQTLNVLLLIVLVSQLTIATLLGALIDRHFGSTALILGLVLQVLVFFVIGEVAPKTYAIQHTDRAALLAAPFLWSITRFAPLRHLSRGLIGLANVILPGKGIKDGPFVTEEELRAMADVAAEEEVIEREERQLIHSIFEFGDTLVREVMRPRPDMVAIEADETVEAGMQRAIEGGFSRLPAYEDSLDNVVGLVYLKDLVGRVRAGEGERPVRDALRAAVFVPEQKRVAELLREMQNKQFHMAIVVDEYGGTSGLVTLEDLLEEIVGEITDEYDVEEPGVERLDDGSLRVPGGLPVDDLSRELGQELPDTEWDTVAGLVFNLLGKVPDGGETVTFQGLEFRAERVQGRRIVSVTVRPAEPAPAADGRGGPPGDGAEVEAGAEHPPGSPPRP